MNTPIVFIEEHNEAFLCWHRFLQEGLIKKTGNYLLHIDHHEDFCMGAYSFDVNNIPMDLESIEYITYNQLGIAEFIAPAVHEKLFSTVHILQNTIPRGLKITKMVSMCPDGRTLSAKEYIPFIHKKMAEDQPDQYTIFTEIEHGLGNEKLDTSLMPDGRYVLDIDLDYFCWDNSLSTVGPKRIEITETAYEQFCSNKYHPFRILPIKMLQAVEDGGRYYLEYNEKIVPDAVQTEERIEKRIVRLVEWLNAQEAKPSVIDVCSSRFSGYLPSYAWPYVKDRLLEELDRVTNW